MEKASTPSEKMTNQSYETGRNDDMRQKMKVKHNALAALIALGVLASSASA